MKLTNQPIQLFLKWFKEESEKTSVDIPQAVCLSTTGLDDFPNARFVSFKKIRNDGFIITGPLQSRKALEIKKNNKVALTFWWAATERQVRVQGIANPISEIQADAYFNQRNRYSQAVSHVCEQGAAVDNIEQLEKKVSQIAKEQHLLERPKDWGGFSIQPVRIEFMEFKKTRFHDRKLFEFNAGVWNIKQIQP